MTERRILVGTFDLFHTGHVGQIAELSGPRVELLVGVLTDEGVREFLGEEPFMADFQRAAVVDRVRRVDGVFLVGPETGWSIPDHDALYVDDVVADGFNRVRADLHPAAVTVRVTKLPTHPLVAGVLTAMPSSVA